MKQTELNVQISSEVGSQSGTCVLAEYNNYDGLTFAAFILLVIWSVTALTIWIPVVHFISVPVGTICGVVYAVFAFKKRRNKRAVINGESTCPKCLRDLCFSFSDANTHLDGVCPKCACCYKVKIPQTCEK